MITQTSLPLGYNHRPLSLTSRIDVANGWSLIQTYDYDNMEYIPNHELTPLVLTPKVYTYNPDTDEVKLANAELVNVQWVVKQGSQETIIYRDTGDTPEVNTSTNTTGGRAYMMTTSGAEKGKLMIAKNCQYTSPMTFTFRAQLLDARLGQIHTIEETKTLRTDAVSAPRKLILNVGRIHRYNPLRDDRYYTVKAQYIVGEHAAECPNVYFRWFLIDSVALDGTITWREYGTHPLDLELAISDNEHGTCVVDCELIQKQSIKCQVYYDDHDDNAQGKAEPDDSFVFCVHRWLPRITLKAVMPQRLTEGVTKLCPNIIGISRRNVLDSNKLDEVMQIDLRMAKLKAVGQTIQTEYSTLGTGTKPTIDISQKMDALYGGKLVVEGRDRGPWGVMADGDGKVIVDGDGKFLLIR